MPLRSDKPAQKKSALKIICSLLVPLFFSVPIARAQINDWETLRTSIAGGATTVGVGTITVGHDSVAIEVNRANITLQGTTSANFDAKIGDVSAMTQNPVTLTPLDFNTWVNSWSGGYNTVGLSTIKGDGTPRTLFADTLGNNNKWLTTPSTFGHYSDGNGLNLKNLRFNDVDVEYVRMTVSPFNGRYVNGLIGNNNNASSFTSLGNILGNAFTDITVTLKSNDAADYLAGGGVIGVRSTGDTAEMGIVSGNYFNGINITTTDAAGTPNFVPSGPGSAYLEGGGLIGVNAASSPADVAGHASMPELSKNYFTGIRILSNDVLLGGGLVGLNNNSKHLDPSNTYARLDKAQGNIFGNGQTGDIKVEVGFSLRGGGVLGLNGLSSAQVMLHDLKDNAFAGISVETGTYIRGGGIVGLQTNDGGDGKYPDVDPKAAGAYLNVASGNLFLNNQMIVGTYMEGGGAIGLRSNMGKAELDVLENNIFKGIAVSTGANLSGGAVVGLSSVMDARLLSANKNRFDDLNVDVRGLLNGGGIIGVHAKDENGYFSRAMAGNILQNSFTNLEVHAVNIHGGGIIGAANETGIASIYDVSGNVFKTLGIATDNDLVGGGVLGVWADDVMNNTPALAGMANIADNLFTDGNVWVGGNLIGGGIIGVRSNYAAMLNEVVRNQFIGNTIHSDGYIDGGGIIGVTGDAATDPVALFKLIGESTFSGNTVSAGGDILGGIVYSYGLSNTAEVDDGLIIKNSVFTNNSLSSTGGTVYGTVTVDTGMPVAYVAFDAADPFDLSKWTFDTTTGVPHTLTLTATNGKSTVFNYNEINDVGGKRFNSLYFGTIPDPASGTPDPARDNALLVVSPDAGGYVFLYDPIWVNQDNGYTFNMNVTGAGNFIWGGDNVFETAGTSGSVTLATGSTTILDGGSTTTYVGGQTTPLAMIDRYTMSLDAPNFTFNLFNGARLNVEGHNVFDLSGNDGSFGAPPVANLNGNLNFNLNNTEHYHQGELPKDYSGNPAYQPLLTVKVPDAGQGMVDLSNSTVTLSNFATGPLLTAGDRFYLIELDNGTTDDSNNKAFTSANPTNNTAYARQGMTIGYTFIIDKNLDNLGNEEDTRFLVARLEDMGAPPESKVPNTGRDTGITFLHRGYDMFP
ncbi:MAG: hypothetical protein FWD31_04135, partial [Planctomycetaceae bacterium]|nr:hypothetical protein [Planctomycetaceae bacterium]